MALPENVIDRPVKAMPVNFSEKPQASHIDPVQRDIIWSDPPGNLEHGSITAQSDRQVDPGRQRT